MAIVAVDVAAVAAAVIPVSPVLVIAARRALPAAGWCNASDIAFAAEAAPTAQVAPLGNL